jgi:hypothetical protein
MAGEQTMLHLQQPSANEILAARIAALSSELETCGDGFRLVTLSCEIDRLKRLIVPARCS